MVAQHQRMPSRRMLKCFSKHSSQQAGAGMLFLSAEC